MSNLSAVEKKLFEDMFGMRSGYVLDFTNRTFEAFFRDTVAKDIYSSEYEFNGDSKANRLRAFWEHEPDAVVGKALSEILEVWKYLEINISSCASDPRYDKCRTITERLLGKGFMAEDPEKRFMKMDFGNISIEKIPIESSLIPILKERLEEAQRCFQCDSPLAVIFLCGSILEGLLLGVAIQQQSEFNQAENSPKDKAGKVKPFREWSLSQFIDVACDLEILKLDVKKFSHGLRDFRNYIHPYQQMTSRFNPDKHTAEICLQVMKAAIACLNGERK